jgi:hypothetical protein
MSIMQDTQSFLDAVDSNAIAAALGNCPSVKIEMSPHGIFALVGLLQLALRHPNIQPDSETAKIGQEFIQGARTILAEIDPALGSIIDLGALQNQI